MTKADEDNPIIRGENHFMTLVGLSENRIDIMVGAVGILQNVVYWFRDHQLKNVPEDEVNEALEEVRANIRIEDLWLLSFIRCVVPRLVRKIRTGEAEAPAE
jgi:hypothetical protein